LTKALVVSDGLVKSDHLIIGCICDDLNISWESKIYCLEKCEQTYCSPTELAQFTRYQRWNIILEKRKNIQKVLAEKLFLQKQDICKKILKLYEELSSRIHNHVSNEAVVVLDSLPESDNLIIACICDDLKVSWEIRLSKPNLNNTI
jgi:hypothetical protein